MNRDQFLTYLHDLKTQRKSLTGQAVADWDPKGSYDALVRSLPHVPAMLGATIKTGQADNAQNVADMTELAVAHATSGGIILADSHFANPWADSSQQGIWSAWIADPTAAKPDLNILTNKFGVSPAYLSFWSQVDRVVDFFKKLSDDAIIIYRPFHEANGTWFWWGIDATDPAQEAKLVALSTALRAYVMPKVRQQILWMHAGTSLSWYGPWKWGMCDGVDLVGCSMYRNTLDYVHPQDLTDMQATGKPMFWSEVGPDVSLPQPGNWDSSLIDLWAMNDGIVGWQAWHDMADGNGTPLHLAPASNLRAGTLYNSPDVVTLDQFVAASTAPTPEPPQPPQGAFQLPLGAVPMAAYRLLGGGA